MSPTEAITAEIKPNSTQTTETTSYPTGVSFSLRGDSIPSAPRFFEQKKLLEAIKIKIPKN